MTDTYHHGDLRKAMIKKGMEMLSQDGIENFSMRKLAAELGVSHTAPYRHFKNKTEAVKTILMESSRTFTRALEDSTSGFSGNAGKEEPPTPKDGMERLIRLGIEYVKFFVENPEFMKFFHMMSDQASILETLFPSETNAGETDSRVTLDQSELKCHLKGANYESLSKDSSYGIFRNTAGEILSLFPHLSEREVLLGYWGKVHGLASLLITQPRYIPEEERDAVIERIIRTPF